MIITLSLDAEITCIDAMINELESLGFECQTNLGKKYTIIHVIGDTSRYDHKKLYAYACVKSVIRIQEPYQKTQKQSLKEKTIIEVKNLRIGDHNPVYIGGPCSIESLDQMDEIASIVASSGAQILRGGAFKPRTSPYDFQGFGKEALEHLKTVGEKYQLITVSEILDVNDLALFENSVDIIQVGARNMQNTVLLKALGKSSKPVLLKRGFGNTVEEWLMSAEYIIANGNPNVILCERGIRTFEPSTRHTLDLAGVLYVKQISHLPVIVDPSHAAGRWELVEGLAKASIAMGADGVMIEVHPDPERALSDGAQALKPSRFKTLIKQLNRLHEAKK